jgi:nucleotide-binding universal stress UspA family protein
MTIVVGYAPTVEGEAALAAAGEEARLRECPLLVVSSTRGESHVAAALRPTSALALAVAELRSSGVDCEIRHHEHESDPAEAIISVAEEVQATRIVIGLKRRSAVGKLLLGSTAQRVLMQAGCSVVAVRPGARA